MEKRWTDAAARNGVTLAAWARGVLDAAAQDERAAAKASGGTRRVRAATPPARSSCENAHFHRPQTYCKRCGEVGT